MKKILVPTDFSQNAKHALRVAAGIAARMQAKLIILHTNTAIAYAPPLPEYSGVAQFELDDYYEMATTELFNMKTELVADPKFAALAIETRIDEGFLYASIRRVAEEESVDMIIMGTKGASGAVEFFIGSNTEKVIRSAKCPVLAVPETAPDVADFNKVILSSTLLPDQDTVFRLLGTLQQSYPFEVQILYMNNPAGFDSNEEINAKAQEFAQKAGLNNVTVNISSNTFNEEGSILEFSKTENAQLIVMGTHQRKGLSHLLFGSLTEDTVNHSSIPVLSVPL